MMHFAHLLTWWGAVVFAIEMVALFTAFWSISEVRTPQGATAWVILLITFPFVGLPLYWIFGRTKFNGYVEALRVQMNKAKTEEKLVKNRQFRAELPPSIAARFGVLEKLGISPFTRGNHAEVLLNGKATFDAIFAAIEAATSYVMLQFFIVRDDQLGQALKELLIRKAAQGVRINFLYDEIGSRTLPQSYEDELLAAGVKISGFKTTRGSSNRFQLNFRNHRKIVITDGRAAFVGGLNVGDEYMGRDKKVGPWRDTHMRIEGPAVQWVQVVFVADWYWAQRTIPEAEWTPQLSERGNQTFLVLPTSPAEREETCELFFLQAINSAKTRLWIASPYFVPDAPVFQALKLAALRGVDVRIIVPRKPDHILVYLASFSFLHEAEKAGMTVFRYKEGFMHQKAMVVDDDVAAIGTANLDNRSLRLNFEITMLGADNQFNADVATMLDQDLKSCAIASPRDLETKKLPFRLAVKIARLLEPIL